MQFLTDMTNTWTFWIVGGVLLVALIGLFLFLRNKGSGDDD